MDGKLVNGKKVDLPYDDILGWDVASWTPALAFLDAHLPCGGGGLRALELGCGTNGGLSLWLALRGFEVVCSAFNPRFEGVSPEARAAHSKFGVEGVVQYEEVDATAIPYRSAFDVVCFKSVLGGIVREGDLSVVRGVLEQVRDALRPGGVLVFAENLEATRIHAQLRRRFGSGRDNWRYFEVAELAELLTRFASFEYETFGVLGCFGRNEAQRRFLAGVERVLPRMLFPASSRYILAGVAKK